MLLLHFDKSFFGTKVVFWGANELLLSVTTFSIRVQHQLQYAPFFSMTNANLINLMITNKSMFFFSIVRIKVISTSLVDISYFLEISTIAKYKPLGRLFLLPLGALVIFVCPRLDFDVAFALNDYMVIIYRIYCLVHCCNSFDWVLLQSAVWVDAQILPRLWIFSLFQF